MRRLAYLVVLGGIVGANLVVAGRNAVVHPYTRTATSSYAAARDSSVGKSFGVYYFLRHALDGCTLVVPKDLGAHLWFFERISRLTVELVDEFPLLAHRRVRKLRARADRVLRLRGDELVYKLYFFETRGARRYLFAKSDASEELLLMSEELYRRQIEAASP